MKRSAIDWCDYTWNPVTGCRHGCGYCYARKITRRFSGDVRLNKMAKGDYHTVPARDGSGDVYILDRPMRGENGAIIAYPFGFEPTLHRYRLNALSGLGRGQNVFVGAMADLFGDWVPDEWIREVFDNCGLYPQHNYLLLTKNPKRYEEISLPAGDAYWYGCTVTGGDIDDRIGRLPETGKTFVSIEPILEDIAATRSRYFCDLDWVIIGAETGGRAGKVIPAKEWVEDIAAEAARWGIPVFMKDSLMPIMGAEGMIQEYPSELRRAKKSPAMERKLYAKCCECGGVFKKSEMATLMARVGRGEQPRQYGWMCGEDFERFCTERNLDVPDLFGGKEKRDENL